MLLCSSTYFLATQNVEVNLLVLLNSLLALGFSPNTGFHFALIIASQLQASWMAVSAHLCNQAASELPEKQSEVHCLQKSEL